LAIQNFIGKVMEELMSNTET